MLLAPRAPCPRRRRPRPRPATLRDGLPGALRLGLLQERGALRAGLRVPGLRRLPRLRRPRRRRALRSVQGAAKGGGAAGAGARRRALPGLQRVAGAPQGRAAEDEAGAREDDDGERRRAQDGGRGQGRGGQDGGRRGRALRRLQQRRRRVHAARAQALDGHGQGGSEIPDFKGSYLGRFPLVSANFWTSDHVSERSRSVHVFPGTRARGPPTWKRRRITRFLPRS